MKGVIARVAVLLMTLASVSCTRSDRAAQENNAAGAGTTSSPAASAEKGAGVGGGSPANYGAGSGRPDGNTSTGTVKSGQSTETNKAPGQGQ